MRFAVLFLLVLGACDSDTFVGDDTGVPAEGGADVVGTPDGEGVDVQVDVVVGETGTIDSSTGDAAVSKSIDCNGTLCSDICCGGLTAWGGPFCQPASAENTTLCTNWLQCDDHKDCPANQYCCATQTFNGITKQNVLDHSYCAPNCMATQGALQVCTQGGECVQGNCLAYGGDPGWVKTCQ